MSKINSFIKIIKKNPKRLIRALADNKFFNWLPDRPFLKMVYWSETGKKLNIEDPKNFNEKLQWLKLNDRKPEYNTYVDKYAVKSYVSRTIGEQYIVPNYEVYDNVSQINWDKLPKKFVLKCTHGSGCNIICNNKDNLDIKESIRKLNIWMEKSWYWFGREWPYKDIKPRIICEKFLEEDIYDYKFYCFEGKPKFLYVAQGDNTKGTLKMSFYDLNWDNCEFFRSDHEKLAKEHPKPENFEEMVKIATKLCQGFKFIRVDLFNVSGKLYFGELTFTPASGFRPFIPDRYELEIGNWINLPKSKKVENRF